MAKKTVTLTIKLKDGVTATLNHIGGGLRRMSSAFKNMAVAGVAATTAIIGGLVGLAKAYSAQETVNKKLKDTFDAAGESGAKAVVKWSAWATAIQRMTALGDEEIMNLVALAKTMGVANDKMEESVKGAIGLSKAFGIDLASSMKMVALATQGEYTMLQRYIPALRAVTTDSEKAAVVQEAMARGFKVAQGELDTIAGAWLALKGVIGDAAQEIGRVLFGDGGLIAGLAAVKQKIIDLTEGGAITKWAEQAKEGLDAVVDTIRIIASGGDGGKKVISSIANVLKASLIDAMNISVNLLKAAAPKIGEAMANAMRSEAVPQWLKVVRARSTAIENISKRTGDKNFGRSNIFKKAAKKEEQKILDEMERMRGESLKKQAEAERAAIDDGGSRVKAALVELQNVIDAESQKLEATIPPIVSEGGGTSGGGGSAASQSYQSTAVQEVVKQSKKQNSSFISLGKRLESAFAGRSNLRQVDIGDAVSQVAEWERRGRSVGVSGLGAEAESAIVGGSGLGIGLESRMQELLNLQSTGSGILGGELDDPAVETNTILKEQTALLKERLGGVE